MSPRDRLSTVFAPDVLAALEQLIDERAAELAQTLAVRALRKRSEFLTVAEAADLLRADRQRVYDLLSAGRLIRHKDGSRVLVKRAELEAYLNGNGRG